VPENVALLSLKTGQLLLVSLRFEGAAASKMQVCSMGSVCSWQHQLICTTSPEKKIVHVQWRRSESKLGAGTLNRCSTMVHRAAAEHLPIVVRWTSSSRTLQRSPMPLQGVSCLGVRPCHVTMQPSDPTLCIVAADVCRLSRSQWWAVPPWPAVLSA